MLKNNIKNQLEYDLNNSIKEKIETICIKIYGAVGVIFEEKALEQIKWFEDHKYDKLPICMAKTHLSLSHDKELKGSELIDRGSVPHDVPGNWFKGPF